MVRVGGLESGLGLGLGSGLGFRVRVSTGSCVMLKRYVLWLSRSFQWPDCTDTSPSVPNQKRWVGNCSWPGVSVSHGSRLTPSKCSFFLTW